MEGPGLPDDLPGQSLFGDHGVPSTDLIEDALRTVRLTPEMPDTRTFSKIRKAWEKRKFGDAYGEIEKQLADEDVEANERTVLDALKADLDARLERASATIESASEGPDYARAVAKLEQIVDDWDGRPEAEKAEDTIKALEKDPAIKQELRAAKFLAKLDEKYADAIGGSKSVRKRARAQYEAFLAKYGDTFYAEKARHTVKLLAQD